MEERRKFVRLDTRLDINYAVVPSEAPQPSIAKNISGGGVCLFLSKPLEKGTRLRVAVTLPGRERPVHFIAEVAWCESYEMVGKGSRQRSVEAGVQFVEIAPEDQQAVMQHVILSMQPQPR